ncbi:F0F1 ATP synthase subunit A [Candidatus Peregrinibacteria bacterium]|nr:F0F1 ATP synthase subunit A [Candidatus Peregrinibacteria bacterium]
MALSNLEIHIAPKTLFEISPGIPITNTIVTMWIVMAILIAISLILRKNLKYLPSGFQNFTEWVFSGLENYMVKVGGAQAKQHFVPFITFFLTILFSNWLGLALGMVAEESGFLRAPTSDLNSTIAFAAIAFVYFEYQGIKAHGFFGYLGHFVNLKALFTKKGMGLIEFFTGLLHIISEVVRPVALSLRLFGNIFGGEIVLMVAFLLVKGVIPIPFMLIEFIVGFIQAFVFATLFLVFTNLNTLHTESDHS